MPIQFNHGAGAPPSTLAVGQPSFDTTNKRLYVGDGTTNHVVSPPPGSIAGYPSATPPAGWLLCDGSAVSRTTYAALFAVCGTTFGAGDGSTTFNVPNLQDRLPLGAGGTYSLGATGGAATVTLATGNLPSHTHSISVNTTTNAVTSISTNTATFDNNGGGSTNSAVISVSATTGALTASGTSGATGSGTAFSILNPYLVVRYIINT